ncbi:DNA helicase [Yoonia sp. 2307UL14-13]|uniref:DNA helicase n=1 Tax=Yoonia sp. 2307UL14-13 TaxID=3126506 RepID=UPI0030AF33F0
MILSASIPALKRKAKALARDRGIRHHQALDQLARAEGFQSWSHLSAQGNPFTPGDFILLGARPGHGKTLMALRLLTDAVRAGRRGYFFTLEYTTVDVIRRLRQIGTEPRALGANFILDTSDEISADYIITKTADAATGEVIIVDYLQLLDQRRSNPLLAAQVAALSSYAQRRRLIIVAISQIDRAYEESADTMPDLSHVRLPNPVDLNMFTKTCFLHAGQIQINRHPPG